jgi:hypothetical protein
MAQILGSAQQVEVQLLPATTWLRLVCLRTSSVNTTLETTQDQTNCGVLTAVGAPSMTIDFDAICETAPSASQLSYKDLLNACAAAAGPALVNVRMQSPVATGSSAGAIYHHEFNAYVSDLVLNQATAEFINFSGTFSSTGALDILP